MSPPMGIGLPTRQPLQQLECRLCGGTASLRFGLKVIGKYDAGYFLCSGCCSLQTESPFWLDEAYALKLPNLDTGAAQRNLDNLGAVFAIARLFGAKNILDIGGKDGLLCRMLRDYNFNCFTTDKYAEVTYAEGFTEPDFQRPDLVTAFEVLEHFANPSTDLDLLFETRPKLLLVSTGIFTTEKEDWWYLAAEAGQHVFFYSPEALRLIAAKYNYHLVVRNWFILFVDADSFSLWKGRLAGFLLRPNMRRLARAWAVFQSATGHQRDHLTQKSRASVSNTPPP